MSVLCVPLDVEGFSARGSCWQARGSSSSSPTCSIFSLRALMLGAKVQAESSARGCERPLDSAPSLLQDTQVRQGPRHVSGSSQPTALSVCMHAHMYAVTMSKHTPQP